jgi:hypothetical protein
VGDGDKTRTVAVPVFALVLAGVVLGAAGVIIFVALRGGNGASPSSHSVATTTSSKTSTTTTTTSIPPSPPSTTTTSPLPPPTTAVTAPPTPPTPDGTLVVEGVGPSDPTGTLGQGEGYGCTGIWTCTASSYTACSDWKLNLINNSDTEIVEFTFSPPSAAYYDSESNVVEQATPSVMQESVSIPAHSSQIESFQSCTTTPPPTTSYARFSVFAPASLPFAWVTGATGTAGWLD